MEHGDAVLRDPLRDELRMLLDVMEVTTAEALDYVVAPDLATVGYHLAVLQEAGIAERIGGVWRRRRRLRPTRAS